MSSLSQAVLTISAVSTNKRIPAAMVSLGWCAGRFFHRAFCMLARKIIFNVLHLTHLPWVTLPALKLIPHVFISKLCIKNKSAVSCRWSCWSLQLLQSPHWCVHRFSDYYASLIITLSSLNLSLDNHTWVGFALSDHGLNWVD